jgi:hypothetical protein
LKERWSRGLGVGVENVKGFQGLPLLLKCASIVH